MCSVNASRICGGVTFAVVAVTLAAITAIALAIIFAPPFLAAYAAVALYVSVGCGIGAAVATLAATILLRNRSSESTQNSSSEKEHSVSQKYSHNKDSTEELEPPTETKAQRTARIESYLNKADTVYYREDGGDTYSETVKLTIDSITSHPDFENVKDQFLKILAKFDLEQDEDAENAIEILGQLGDILDTMGKAPSKKTSSSEED